MFDMYLSNWYKVCEQRVITEIPISRHITLIF